jgi:nucleoid-associated protein YejK
LYREAHFPAQAGKSTIEHFSGAGKSLSVHFDLLIDTSVNFD